MRKQMWLMGLMLLVCLGVAQAQTPTEQTPKKLYVVGTSHLDTQWRWTIQTSINEYIPATFRDNFKLLELYPKYVFSFEGAFRYSLFKEYHPEEYAKLKPYIDAGRWRVTGSWWDAADVNVPSFESLVRQTLYGNGYWKREFGKKSRDIFLPDCFGFGFALPSMARYCGLESFSTQKLTWGSAYGVPFDIGKWRGVDGSTIFAGINPGSYGSQIHDDLSRDTLWGGRIQRQQEKSGLNAAYMYFGTGDIGGSPESLSVAWLQKSIESDGPITVSSVGADDLVELANSCDTSKLPSYTGELVMTRHGVGCYSSQAAMKRWNRMNEQLGDAAERASVIAYLTAGLPYPREELRDTWQRFLWHQFHDDLTGTSVPEAYEFSWSDELLCQNRFAQILENAVAAVASDMNTKVKGTPLVLFNPLSIDRADIVDAVVAYPGGAPKGVKAVNYRGEEVPVQINERWDDSLRVAFPGAGVPIGFAICDLQSAKAGYRFRNDLKITDSTLENERYLVRVNRDGDVSSILDKVLNKELLTAPIRFQLLDDKPKRWPAWEIDYEDVMRAPRGFVGGPAEIKVLETGPAQVALEVTRKTENSMFRTVISLAAGGQIVRFDNEVDWYEQATLLKVALPLASANDSVTYDIGLGTIKRGLNHEKLYEVIGQQWADMTAPDSSFGVAVLNDCKYGWDHPDTGTLRLTLIHTPFVYDNWSWVGDESTQDMGHHTFAFAVQSHGGNCYDGNVAWEAAKLNQPVRVFATAKHKGGKGSSLSLLSLSAGKGQKSPQAMVTAVKLSEASDNLVVRLRNLLPTPCEGMRVELAGGVASAEEVNGQEETVGPATFDSTGVTLALRGFQPMSVLAKPSTLTVTMDRIGPEAIALPFDADGISKDVNRKDGNLDGRGNSISGDLLPDVLWRLSKYHNVPFVFGSKVDGAKNVVTCTGQQVALPKVKVVYCTGQTAELPENEGADVLYVLAAAIGGAAEGTFVIGKDSVNAWVQDWAEPVGQWNNRLVAGKLVEKPEQIAPAYIDRQPVAWYGSHRHTAAGENEAYRFSYLYLLTFDLPSGTKSITLPNNPRIKVLAATVAKKLYDDVRAAQPLYDVTNATVAKIAVDSTRFLGQATVTMSSPVAGATLHYTLDGAEPTTESPLYSAPLTIDKSTTIKARAIKPGADDHYVASTTLTKLTPWPAVTLVNPLPGMSCSYYEGEWARVPDFDAIVPVKDTVMGTVQIPSFARKELYGLQFRGYINVPADGAYELAISSDDGSRLLIDDSLVVDNDGVHGSGDVTGLVALKAGPHRLVVQMFQAKGDQDLALSITGPGLPKQKVTSDMLWRWVMPNTK